MDTKKMTVDSVLALEKYRDQNVLVVNTTCGGVHLEHPLAHFLNAESSLVVSRKLGYPYSSKVNFGAIAEEGTLFISEMGCEHQTCDDIKQVIQIKKQQIQEEAEKLRWGKPIPDMHGRTVILTSRNPECWPGLIATSLLCKKKGAAKIVVVLDKIHKMAITKLESKVNEVLVLDLAPPFSHHPQWT